MTDFAERDAKLSAQVNDTLSLRGGGGALFGKPVSRSAAGANPRADLKLEELRVRVADAERNAEDERFKTATLGHMILRLRESDPTTDMRPITHAQGHALRGRMLAAQGKKQAAEAAFEEAIEVSHRTGLRLLEMFALRDLKKHVLDGDGRGEEGTRRLKAVLSEMEGPPAELTKLLGEGLDAEAILRS